VGNLIQNSSFEITGSIPGWQSTGAVTTITDMRSTPSGSPIFKPTDGSRMALLHTFTGAVPGVNGLDTSTMAQSTSVLQPGKVYSIRFDYNFMSNEFPTQLPDYNDTFQARFLSNQGSILLAEESRAGSNFKNDKGEIVSGGKSDAGTSDFTLVKPLNAPNGYTDWKTGTKSILAEDSTGILEFRIFDGFDNNFPSGVVIDNATVEQYTPLALVPTNQTLIGPSQNPLVEFSNQQATFDSALVASGSGSSGAASVNLSGPLLKATGSNLNVPYSLLGLLNGSRLVSSSTDPLVWLQGGDHSLSSLKGSAMFDFWGVATTADPQTGVQVGSGTTVTHSGPLLQATQSATINTHKVLKLDTALLEATLPVIHLIGGAGGQTSLTSQSSAIDLFKAKVVSTGPVIALDKGLINVNNGALINLTAGSQMITTGHLLSLTNGSKINVVNGPLISVSGAGSALNVGGALAQFGGTGGNQIVVNNNIKPTATMSGLGVSATHGGSVTIGPHPVVNPNLGKISVKGSLIQANNGGTVTITAK
jgi:hypothetical protein